MGKPTGFMEYNRVDGPVIGEDKRIKNFSEFHGMLSEMERREQAARGILIRLALAELRSATGSVLCTELIGLSLAPAGQPRKMPKSSPSKQKTSTHRSRCL